MSDKSPSPSDNTSDATRGAGGGSKPQTPAQYNHFPHATFAHEVASELGIDAGRLASLASEKRSQINAMEEKSHSQGP